MSRGSAAQRSLAWTFSLARPQKRAVLKRCGSDFPRRGGALRETTSKDRFSARFIAYEARSHWTSPRGSSWVQALPGKFRGNHNPGFEANRGVQWSKKIVSSPLLKETPDMCELYSVLNDKSDPCARSNPKNYGMCRKCRISLAKLGRIVLPWTRGFLKAGTTS